jgi:uncharacterized protein YlxW (UPF0749 family)
MTARVVTVAVMLSALTVSTTGQSADGIVITQRVAFGGAPLTIRVHIDATRMRTEMASPSGVANVTIFDGSKQVLYMVDPARQTYVEMTKADVDRLSAQVQEAAAQMQSQLEKLPRSAGGWKG